MSSLLSQVRRMGALPPLAAALAVRSVFGAEDERWSPTSARFRAVWLIVLLAGMGFGIAGVQPIPVIILAQAFNGLLLPFIAVFLWMAMNDRALLGEGGVSSRAQNLAMGAVVLVCELPSITPRDFTQ